jgi:hypothetical protein
MTRAQIIREIDALQTRTERLAAGLTHSNDMQHDLKGRMEGISQQLSLAWSAAQPSIKPRMLSFRG